MSYSSKLKMKKEHFDSLKDKIMLFLNVNAGIIERYETGHFIRSDKVNCLQTRFNNDILTLSVDSAWICNNLYPYLNDKHIETALSKIVPPVVRKY